MRVLRTLSVSCLFNVCSDVSEALLRVLRTLSVSCLFNVCSDVSEALLRVLRTLSVSCLFNVCSDVSEALLRVLRTLSVSCLLCLLRCFRGSLAGFTHFIRLSPVQCLLRCFRGSGILIVLCFIAWDILPGCALRLDGKAWPHPQTARLTLTATLRTYLVDREQRSTMTEERNSKTASRRRSTKITTRHLADSHAPANGITHIRACAMDRWRLMLRQTIHPHTRMRDGSLAYAFSLVFTPYLWNAVVSGKSPRSYPSSRCSQPVGATHGPPRSL